MSSRARQNPQAESDVQRALQQLESEALNFAYRFIDIAKVRSEYISRTQAFAAETMDAYRQGALSAGQAAEAAQQMRNQILEMCRAKSSDLGKAIAQAMKRKGLDLEALTARYAAEKYKRPFAALNAAERDEVFLEVVRASGRPQGRANLKAARLGAAGRALWVLTFAIAAYNVGTAEYKTHALGREVAGAGGGFAGGAAGGAIAGVWFGPVGVAVGVIVGGVLGSIMADQVYVEVTGPREIAVRKFLPQFTHMFHVEEDAMADAMISRLGIDLDAVHEVFRELERTYTSDADDVALLYVEKVHGRRPPSIIQGLKLNGELRRFLVELLEDGWTSEREKRAIGFLQSLEEPA
jgi:hypothetical protein